MLWRIFFLMGFIALGVPKQVESGPVTTGVGPNACPPVADASPGF